MAVSASGIAAGTVISADPRARREPSGELWSYRELLYFLIRRDITVRYAHTALGALWALLQPTAAAAAFTVVFGRIAHLPSDGIPYPIFAFAGLVPWMYVSGAVMAAGASLLNNAHLITKVYFPRIIIPLATVGSGLLDLGVALLLLGGTLAVTGYRPAPVTVALVPLLVALFATIATGAGCWVSALSVRYRDVKHILPLLMMLWLYASPIAYPMSRVPPAWRWLYACNPLAGAIEAFRNTLVGHTIDWSALAISTVAAIGLCASGIAYFRGTERTFADAV